MNFNKTLIAAAVASLSFDTLAAAFQLAEQNASGLGRAYAGEASVADDASVVGRNPALMSLFDKAQVSAAAVYIKPDVSLKGESTNNGMDPAVLDDGSIAPSAVVPAAYLVLPVNDKVALGLGAYSNFGLATEFADNYAAGQLAGDTEITTVNMNLSAAYKVSEQFSIGLGLNYVYADAKVIRHFGASPLPLPAQTEAVNLEGDDYGFGWNLGLMYQLDGDSRFGFNYRSETDIAFSGEYSNQIPAAFGGTGGMALPGKLDLTLPAMAEFSGSHRLNETTGLHYSIQWTGWSSFDKLEAFVEGVQGAVFTKQEKFKNSLRYAVGGDYALNEALTLRAGIAYDNSPVEHEHLSISIPDTDRTWFSFGANYKLDQQASFDLGASVLRGKTRHFVESDALGQQWGFESKGHAYLLGAQFNYSF